LGLRWASYPPHFGPAFRLFEIAPGDLVGVDVNTCVHCGGTARIVAAVEEPTAMPTRNWQTPER